MSVSTADGLVGREAELRLASAAFRQLTEGRSAALTLEGEAGIGKTRLVHRIIDEARSRGVTVFSGEAHPFERTRPFGVMAAALDLSRRSPDPRRAAIGELLSGPRTGGRAGGRAGTSGDVQYRLVEEIVELVETSCARHPVMLVAEDVHWADSGSLLAISSVVRHLQLSPVLVVVTLRPSPLSAEVVRLLDDLEAAGAQTVRLRPLSSEEMTLLAGQVLGAPPGPGLSTMVDKAGGNPLWAVAMLRSLEDEGLLTQADGSLEVTSPDLPASLSDLVVRRLRHLPKSTLALLQVTAVLGDAVSLRDVATVARLPATEVVTQLGEAFDAQLLDEADGRIAFRHQIVHDAIYRHVPPSARRLLHREAAVALMAAGADRLDVADQLILGAEPGDEEAVAWLRDAAREASPRAPLVAVDLMRGAERLLPEGHPDGDVVSAELVQALLRAGRVAEASTRAEAVLARQHSAELDTPLRLSLLGALALQNRADELIAVAQDGLDDSRVLTPFEQVPMLAQQSWALTYAGDARAGESAARRALLVAEQAGHDAMAVLPLMALMVALGRQGRHSEALAQARRAVALAAGPEAKALPVQPKLFLGLALFDCDLVDEARAAYREALDEFGSGWWLSDTLVADAVAAFAIGEWQDAAPGLIAAGEAAKEKDHPLLLSQSLAYRTVIATAAGDLDAARDLASEFVGVLESDEPGYNAGVLGMALSGVRAAEGDREAAYDVLLRCWRHHAAREDLFYHRTLAPDLVRLALALGHGDVALEVSGAAAAGAVLAPEVASVRALALRLQGLVDGDVEPLLEAVALTRSVPLFVDHAGTCEDTARLLASHGRVGEATALLTEALEAYDRAGADAWAGRVRAQLRSLGVRLGTHGPRHRPAGGWDSLTPTERAVSVLVAKGLTNGAVARRLYISPHTVNTHLRHVFAKLDVSNRVALAAVVHQTVE